MAFLRKKLRSKFWYACFALPNGERTQRSTKTSNRGEALRIAIKFEDLSIMARQGKLVGDQFHKLHAEVVEIVGGKPVPNFTVESYLRSWLARKKDECSKLAHDKYTSVIGKLIEFLGLKAKDSLERLTTDDILQFRQQLSGKLSPGTVNISLKIVRASLNSAVADSLISKNPAIRVSAVKGAESKRRAFTLAELQRLLPHCQGEWRGMTLCGGYTGLRLRDCAKLRWTCINFETLAITVKTQKTGAVVTVPMAIPLLSYLQSVERNGDYVFPTMAPQLHGTLSNQFHSILVKAKLVEARSHKKVRDGRDGRREQSELSFHSLRHFFNTILRNSGVSSSTAMAMLGHESEEINIGYCHVDLATMRTAIAVLPDITQGLQDQPFADRAEVA